MKLLSGARAVLSLGPRMCRDKFVQAAGRLRQLDKGQSLALVGTMEVVRLVQQCCGLGSEAEVAPRHVMAWVHGNTATQIQEVRCSTLHCCLCAFG